MDSTGTNIIRLIDRSIPTIFFHKEKPKAVLKVLKNFNLNIVFLPERGDAQSRIIEIKIVFSHLCCSKNVMANGNMFEVVAVNMH